MKFSYQRAVAKAANAIYNSTSLSQSQSWKMAHKAVKLQMQLKQGIAKFSFKKISTGEIRQAVGTLCPDLFDYTPSGNKEKKDNPKVIKYYDLEKQAFRSFRVETLAA